jgi:tocopherol O-methyltransferase
MSLQTFATLLGRLSVTISASARNIPTMITPLTEQTPAAVAAHYDDLDHFYRELWGEHVHHGLWLSGRERPEEAVVQLVERVADRTGVARGDRVCDVGCGYGGTARLLARRYGAEVTALTISTAQFAYAQSRERATGDPEYRLADWSENGLPDGSFDVVLAIESSEHMTDKRRFFGEVARVLKPGGRFAVCAWLAAERPSRWETDHLLEPICREGRLTGMGTEGDYRALASEAGLEVSGFEDLSRQVRKTWSVCAGRAARGLASVPEYRRFLFRSGSPDRVFLMTLFRIWAAYRTGAMRYGLLSAVKPAARDSRSAQIPATVTEAGWRAVAM